MIQINLYGPLNMHHVVVRGMAERGFGRVVNVASDAGRVGSSGEAVYSACKGGIIAFTKTLARELARKGVTLNVMCPGPTDTPLFDDFRRRSPQIGDALARAVPLRRLGEPDDYRRDDRIPAVGRCRLHHRADDQRVRRADDMSMSDAPGRT